jgi:hypothetical protein
MVHILEPSLRHHAGLSFSGEVFVTEPASEKVFVEYLQEQQAVSLFGHYFAAPTKVGEAWGTANRFFRHQ